MRKLSTLYTSSAPHPVENNKTELGGILPGEEEHVYTKTNDADPGIYELPSRVPQKHCFLPRIYLPLLIYTRISCFEGLNIKFPFNVFFFNVTSIRRPATVYIYELFLIEGPNITQSFDFRYAPPVSRLSLKPQKLWSILINPHSEQ